MHRRSLLAGLIGTAFSGTALRAKEVRLPELSTASPLPWFSPRVADRRYLRGFWDAMWSVRRDNWNFTNAEVKASALQYLDAIRAELPVTFIGYLPDKPDLLIETTFHEFVEEKRDDGCKELKLRVSCPQLKIPLDLQLINIECPPA
jgi:hypothetical protein